MDSFRDKLDEIKRLIDDDVFRKRVLLLCQQSEPKSFDEYSSSGSFRRLEKFESSTYSEVLKAIDLADNNKPVVMKIMRALSRGVIKRMPSVTTRGCQAYNDILNELVVTQALSQLHDGVILNGQPNALYRAPFFCFIHEIKVVSGNLSRQLQASRKHKTPKSDAPPSKIEADSSATSISNANLSDALRPSQVPKTSVSETLSSALVSSKVEANQSSVSQDAKAATASTISSGSPIPEVDTGKSQLDEMGPNLSQIAKNMASGQQEVKEAAKKEVNGKVDEADQDDAEESGKFGFAKDEQTIKDDELAGLPEDDRMLMESLPNEYVVSVMRHDGQPLWWMMTHKKLTPEQLASVLIQVIVGLAIAENVYLYEHRDLHVSNILIKRTASRHIPFILDGQRYNIMSHGIKATIIDATFSRLTHNGKVYYRDLTSTLRAYGTRRTPPRMSLQNRSYRQMVRLTKNKWNEFTPKTNLIWLTYLCETLMKNEVMKSDKFLLNEVKKIRDHTLKTKTTFDLLACFPFERTSKMNESSSVKTAGAPNA